MSTSRDLTVAATRRRSSRTRIGKIARLPNEVREELNRRLQDGEPGEALLVWLNALPKTEEVLAAQFGGRPITKQNLSEWKQGGYQDWARAEEDRLRVVRLTEQAARLAGSEEDGPLSERLAAVLLVELAGALDELRDESQPPAERWQHLRQMLREVAQMRREDNRAARLRIEKERWEWESDRLEQETLDRAVSKAKDEAWAPCKAASQLHALAEMFGGGDLGRKMAARMLEIQHDLDPGMLGGHEASGAVKPGPAKSGSRDRSGGSDRLDRSARSGGSSNEVKLSQTQSSQVKANQVSQAQAIRRQDAGGPGPDKPDSASGAEGDAFSNEPYCQRKFNVPKTPCAV